MWGRELLSTGVRVGEVAVAGSALSVDFAAGAPSHATEKKLISYDAKGWVVQIVRTGVASNAVNVLYAQGCVNNRAHVKVADA